MPVGVVVDSGGQDRALAALVAGCGALRGKWRSASPFAACRWRVAERKQIYEALHPETRKGVAGAEAVHKKCATANSAFAKDAAEKTNETERRACEIRLRAERKAGQLLSSIEKAKGGQPYQSHGVTGSDETVATLNELGVSKNQSSRWQQLAAVPEAEFEAERFGSNPTAVSDLPPAAGGWPSASGQIGKRFPICLPWRST
jgi:hypothetical protein